jgi:uncharacterized protein
MGIERRNVPPLAAGLAVEVRGGGDPDGAGTPTIVGHASVFNEWTTLYEDAAFVWRERVLPGAFTRAIREGQDVRSLFNHDPDWILGRTKSGTLLLAEDERGLWTETVPSTTPLVRDLVLEPIRRGDLDGMSFAFLPNNTRNVRDERDTEILVDRGGERLRIFREADTGRIVEERDLVDLDLFDVAPVTYPAYGGTDLSLRVQAEGRSALYRTLHVPARIRASHDGLRLRRLAGRLTSRRHT